MLINEKYCKQLTNLQALIIYALVSFFLFFEMAIQVSPSVMAPQLMHDLNLGPFGLGLMSGIYFYSYTAMQIPSGILFDKFNAKFITMMAILLCVLGTFLLGTAQNIYMGSLARLLIGTGSAFAFVCVLVITADLFNSKYFATITGITQMLGALGAMMGQMPVSALVSVFGWRQTLFLFAGVGLILVLATWKMLNPQDMLAPHKKTARPITLKPILIHPQTWFIALYSCLLWAPMSSFTSLWGVPYLMQFHHLSENSAALLCSFMWLGLALVSPLLGMYSTHIKQRVWPLILSAGVGVVAFALILYIPCSYITLGVLLFFAGAACSGQALCFTVVKENNDESAKATAIGFNNMAVVVSGAIFQPLIGKIIELGQTDPHVINLDYFQRGLSIVLLSYLVAFLTAWIFIKEPKTAFS